MQARGPPAMCRARISEEMCAPFPLPSPSVHLTHSHFCFKTCAKDEHAGLAAYP